MTPGKISETAWHGLCYGQKKIYTVSYITPSRPLPCSAVLISTVLAWNCHLVVAVVNI